MGLNATFLSLILSMLVVDVNLYFHLKEQMQQQPRLQSNLTLATHGLISLFFIFTFSLVLFFKGTFPTLQIGWFIFSFNLMLATIYFLKGSFLLENLKKQNPLLQPIKVNGINLPTKNLSRAEVMGKIGPMIANMPILTRIYELNKGKYKFQVKQQEIASNTLPAAFNGLKVAQISDTHLGNFNGNIEQVSQIIDLINAEKPDVLVLTGDIINNKAEEALPWIEIFKKLEAPMGKFAILGNHDYGDYTTWNSQEEKQENLENLKKMVDQMGFQLLLNEHVILEQKGEHIGLIGVENWGLPPFPQYGDLDKAMQNMPPVPFKILLSHDPTHWSEEVIGHTTIDLTLAGHTHGAQIGIGPKNKKLSPARFKWRHWDGLYQEGSQSLYVNRGIGFNGLPLRINMPPEITIFHMQALS